MNEIKKLIKSTGIYFLGTIGTKLVSFLLLPLYTAYIAPEAYGRYDLNINYATLFASFFFLDIWTGIMKFFFEQESDREKQNVVCSGTVIFLGSSMLYLAAMILFGIWNGMEYLPGVIAYGFFMVLQSLYGYLARAYGHNALFATSGIVATLVNALLNVFLIVVVRMDYRALYISYAGGILVQCVMLERRVTLLRAFRGHCMTKEMIRQLFRFSLPLCVNSLCYWLLTGYNRIILTNRLGETANGYYAIAAKFGGTLLIVSSCFSMAWQELAYGKYSRDQDTGRFYEAATENCIQALLYGFCGLIPAISVVFPFLVDASYEGARNLVPLSMAATLAGILYTFLGNIISTYKRNDLMFVSTLAACVVNIVSMQVFVGVLGIQAANLSLLLGYLVSDWMRMRTIRREVVYHPGWRYCFFLLPLAVISVMIYLAGGLWMNLLMLAVAGICTLHFVLKFVSIHR